MFRKRKTDSELAKSLTEQFQQPKINPDSDSGTGKDAVCVTDTVEVSNSAEHIEPEEDIIKKRLSELENKYKQEHPRTKSGFTSVGNWVLLVIVLTLLYFIFKWVMSEGGLPSEFYDLIRRVKL